MSRHQKDSGREKPSSASVLSSAEASSGASHYHICTFNPSLPLLDMCFVLSLELPAQPQYTCSCKWFHLNINLGIAKTPNIQWDLSLTESTPPRILTVFLLGGKIFDMQHLAASRLKSPNCTVAVSAPFTLEKMVAHYRVWRQSETWQF